MKLRTTETADAELRKTKLRTTNSHEYLSSTDYTDFFYPEEREEHEEKMIEKTKIIRRENLIAPTLILYCLRYKLTTNRRIGDTRGNPCIRLSIYEQTVFCLIFRRKQKERRPF